MAKTTIVEMTGFVEWAKIFPENMDDNMEFHAATEGQFNMNFYPVDEEQFEKFFSGGAPTSSMGHDTIKMGKEEIGLGKFIRLKRPNKHKSGIEDFGGAPEVYDFREGPSLKRWSFAEDGELGNGSKVSVKVSIYGTGPRASVRLEKVAVLEQVVFEGGETTKKEGF